MFYRNVVNRISEEYASCKTSVSRDSSKQFGYCFSAYMPYIMCLQQVTNTSCFLYVVSGVSDCSGRLRYGDTKCHIYRPDAEHRVTFEDNLVAAELGEPEESEGHTAAFTIDLAILALC